ncbi:hypothetical protein MNBD_NITROSPINAE04-1980 [hydrothermal vent metagenome]|uniref:DUF202 domain-containing protein n=1 Tax=hydrothermal vent metagenome TaxID=652676 RepID=A0A3B1BTW6_9ZZZZ
MSSESFAVKKDIANRPSTKETQSLAPDSNTLALDRTVLANERTYQAWIRTGLALFIAGLGVLKFLREEMPFWILLVIATLFILFSAIAFLLAAWRYRHFHLRIKRLDIDVVPSWVVITASVLLAATALLALIGLSINIFG